MKCLSNAIDRLERLQAETETRGNSAAGILFETGQFMRDLPVLIDDLKQLQIDLETKNDHSCNCSH